MDLIAIVQSSHFLQTVFVEIFERAIQIKLAPVPMPNRYWRFRLVSTYRPTTCSDVLLICPREMLCKDIALELVRDMKLRRKILEPVLFGYVWVYGPMDMTEDRWGKMVFLANGRTFGYGHPNEYGWDFSNDVFRLVRKDREPTSIYDEAFTEYGRLLLKGRPVENPDSLYCLRQVDYADD